MKGLFFFINKFLNVPVMVATKLSFNILDVAPLAF